jgi:hypothetical protein
MRAIVVLVALAGLSLPAAAQTRPLQKVDEINRSIQRKQRDLGAEQQNQFENNQLRQELSRQRNTPTLTGPSSVPVCRPGRGGC